MLTRLTYASRLSPGTSEAQINEIVSHSAAWNRSVGITGILALDGAKIIQILEGPEWQVGLLFAKIAMDQRHIGVVELEKLEIDQYRYARWGMVRRPMSDMLMSLPAY